MNIINKQNMELRKGVMTDMDGKLNSLTDVLKKTLFFFEALSVAELAPHVQRRMLKDYSLQQVEDKVILCLKQNECFVLKKGCWSLNLEGIKENDPFYALLLKKKQPLNLREIIRNANQKKRKHKKLLSEEALLISDGRFIQLNNGFWGLTEWEVEASHYSIKNIIIKALKMHPGGLSINQLHQIINSWHETDIKVLKTVLKKFPYFEVSGDEVWSYNPIMRVIYEELLKKFLKAINKQKERWHKDRKKWAQKFVYLQKQNEEVLAGQKEVAAALAEKVQIIRQNEHLASQASEKDLLLSLRKKEILRYREHIGKLEAKSNSILYQCRLWVNRFKESQEEIYKQREFLAKNKESLENMFTKLQQYKEKNRDLQGKLAEHKEAYGLKTAELQNEIIDLNNKLEKQKKISAVEMLNLREEINSLSNDLKKYLIIEEEQQRSYVMLQKELAAAKEDYQILEKQLGHPLVRIVTKICSFFGNYTRQSI